MKCISVGALKTSLIGPFFGHKTVSTFCCVKICLSIALFERKQMGYSKKEKKTYSAAVTKFQLHKKIIQISSEF